MVIVVQRVLTNYRAPLIREFQRQGHDVHMISCCNTHLGKLTHARTADGTTSTHINLLPGFLERRGYYFSLSLPWQVLREPAELVILEGESNFLLNLVLVPLLLLQRKPYVWWTLGRPVGTRRTIRRRLAGWLLNWMLKMADRVACYSTAGRDYIIEQGIPAARVMVAQNALDPEFVLRGTENAETLAGKFIHARRWQRRLRLAYVGAMNSDKRPQMLVELAKAYRDHTADELGIIFVGDGPQRAACEELASKLEVDAFFAGQQPPDLTAPYILAADAVVLTGLGGLAINHAMMLGRPVISGPADGTEKDLILDGQTGFYLDPLTSESLLACVVNTNRDALSRMGNNARQHVNRIAHLELLVQRLMGEGRHLGHPGQKMAAA